MTHVRAPRLLAGMLGLAISTGLSSGSVPARAETAHPEQWPRAASPESLTDARTEAFITELMEGLSLEEKVGQVIQADISAITPEDLRDYPLGSILAGGNSAPGGNDRASPAQWLALTDAFRAVAAERRPGHTPIPPILGVDAVHGHNNIVGATIFPHNIGLGAARDPDLVRRIGQATAEEVAVTGFDWTFAPTLAVPRDDRWGRTYEGYGETPEIVTSYAAPMVEGLQGRLESGRALAAGRIAATAKHFLADGGTANGTDQGDAQVSEKELIEIHAPGYPLAIDAGVLTVMASYSSWNGLKNHGNPSLLTDVLKGRMGFTGFLIGDWNGHEQVQGCTDVSCPQAFNAGLDMFMAPDSWKGLYANTLAQARSGEIPLARLDDAVRRILRVKVKARLFEADRPVDGQFDRLAAPEHRALAREAVRKSLVLLKNNGSILPLKASAHVLVAGDGAENIGKQSGGWSITWQATDTSNADFPNGQSIHAGLAQALSAAGGKAELSPDGSFTARPDAAIVVFGERPYAEGKGDIPTLEYQPGTKTDLATLRKLKAAGIPTVAVFLSGRPLWTNPELNAAAAFVAAWLPGTEGGGVADVLLRKPDGEVGHDFTGKLSYSWPRTATGAPLNQGDKGYDPLFAYGYGLSYADKVEVPVLPEGSDATVSKQ
jgi:beta-glucosidase